MSLYLSRRLNANPAELMLGSKEYPKCFPSDAYDAYNLPTLLKDKLAVATTLQVFKHRFPDPPITRFPPEELLKFLHCPSCRTAEAGASSRAGPVGPATATSASALWQPPFSDMLGKAHSPRQPVQL